MASYKMSNLQIPKAIAVFSSGIVVNLGLTAKTYVSQDTRTCSSTVKHARG
jgi:hypothetical protein